MASRPRPLGQNLGLGIDLLAFSSASKICSRSRPRRSGLLIGHEGLASVSASTFWPSPWPRAFGLSLGLEHLASFNITFMGQTSSESHGVSGPDHPASTCGTCSNRSDPVTIGVVVELVHRRDFVRGGGDM